MVQGADEVLADNNYTTLSSADVVRFLNGEDFPLRVGLVLTLMWAPRVAVIMPM